MSDSTPPVPPPPPAPEPPAPEPPAPDAIVPPQPNPYAQANPYGAGQPYAPGQYAPPTNTLAIVALVLAFVFPLGGIICGHIALGQIKRTGESGHGLALAGTVLGYVFVGVTVLFLIIYFVVIFGIAASGGFSTYSG